MPNLDDFINKYSTNETQPETSGQSPPSDMLSSVQSYAGKAASAAKSVYPYLKPPVRPTLEYGGAMMGGALGAGGGPVGIAAGGALGYGLGKSAADFVLGEEKPKTIGEAFAKPGKDIYEGIKAIVEMELGGKAMQWGAKALGAVGKPIMAKISGRGVKDLEQAFNANPEWKKAYQGKISPDAIVENARDALGAIKNNRADAYLKEFGQIENMPQSLDITDIKTHMGKLLEKYGVAVTPKGALDFTNVGVNKAGRNDIKNMVEAVNEWTDFSPVGVDRLKRFVGDFYSESGQARQFATSLRNEIREKLAREIPGYHNMTKDYEEATRLIKDIEAGLMMRKQGMTGRVTADMTLRRLMSAMQDNFALRGELLNSLSTQSGRDLMSQIGGYRMSQYLPGGLAGTVAAGEVGLALLHPGSWNPAFFTWLVAASPKVQGKFLSMIGEHAAGMAPQVGKAATYGYHAITSQDDYNKKFSAPNNAVDPLDSFLEKYGGQ